MKIGKCKSCGAAIIWAMTERGRAMPVDAEPVAQGGTISLWMDDGVLVATAGSGPGSQVSHFATCANAAAHRKPRVTA